MKKIIPMAGYVLIENVEEELSSGVVLAKEETPQTQIGMVIDIRKITPDGNIPPDGFSLEDWVSMHKSNEIEKGNIIIYKKYSGSEVELEGKKYKLVSFSDIVAIIK